MAQIIPRDHPKWLRAEQLSKAYFNKTLAQIGCEGQILDAIARGDDVRRVLLMYAEDHGFAPAVQEGQS
jgi:hypothetical protein